jgi:sugar phosphate isomerase/epimerase
MKPCISEVTTIGASFDEDVKAYSAAGFRAMEVWLTKLETHLEKHSLADTQKLLEDHQMSLAAASYQGGLLISQGEERKVHFDHFRRRLDLCQGLKIPLVLVIADFAGEIDSTSLQRSLVSLKQAAQWGAGANVRLGLEFRSSASFCTSLDTAISVVTQCSESNLGVCLDLFHYYTGPSKLEDLGLLTPENLAWVQLCDLSGVPRELARDADRILPGEGDFLLDPIIARLRAIKFDGYLSVELMNPLLWEMKGSQVAEMGMKAMERLVLEKQ